MAEDSLSVMPFVRPAPTKNERFFADDELIVSKTDLKGLITYANRVFVTISDYSEEELLGKPHNIIRHPDMPKVVFKVLWDTVSSGKEIFAYVKNMAKNGDFYWVYAHVTPTFDAAGKITGYHSSRRTATKTAVARMDKIYEGLRAIEKRAGNAEAGIAASLKALQETLQETGMEYDEFVFSLER